MKSYKKLIVAIYQNEKTADHEFNLLSKKEKKDELDLKAYTVVSKSESGKTTVHDTEGRDAFWGAVVGGLVGMLIGPVGAIYGAALFAAEVFAGSVAAGLGVGALAGWVNSDALKIPNDLLVDIKKSLKPGSSAIVAVVEEDWVDEVEAVLEPQSEMLHHYQFTDSVVEKFEKDWEIFEKEQKVVS
ncbi:DUF1269 domain-containing protein [Flammeovirga kamogawensis]|uniref:DUF1269 domain-containing protein n=1 Tax=Flammeovirga kamogawensis TaxID=373891 RepID=A0ABX8GVP5_9BACT|nr:DUF1269 domain-containing protein [Flammeovirga kamogawensis]MBB6461597.1 putative membrane protein [Flammeovirga kamogawensis]QWG07473.1 DUF1269 domain-containing protein [Flammeovirga kamogawensis]TRX69286.1 DUF1269 domain-containing protein [Flammeovirga kamogawensis]